MSENKGADRLRDYVAADLHLCFRICKKQISHNLAHVLIVYDINNGPVTEFTGGRTGLMVRASDSGSGDPSSILGRVGVFVSLSKRHLLPKSTGNTQE